MKACSQVSTRGPAKLRPSPNRLFIGCMPPRALIRLAFFPGQNPRDQARLVGGPDWLDSGRSSIAAIAEAHPPRATLIGLIFQRCPWSDFVEGVPRDALSSRVFTLDRASRDQAGFADRWRLCSATGAAAAAPRKPDCDLIPELTCVASTAAGPAAGQPQVRTSRVWRLRGGRGPARRHPLARAGGY